MSSQGNGHPVPFAIHLSEHTKAELRRQYLEQRHAGKGSPFITALRQIIERLRREPRDFGEPLYRLPALKLTLCVAVVSPLVVDFAVHQEQPLVFIRSFKILH
jgi:hypothetical protein